MMAGRSLDELLKVIGADQRPGLLMPSDPRILQAFTSGLITPREARTLQGYTNADPTSQKRRVAAAQPAGSAEVEKLKAKLAAMRAELEKQYPRDGDVR